MRSVTTEQSTLSDAKRGDYAIWHRMDSESNTLVVARGKL